MNKAIEEKIRSMEELRWKKDETPYYLFTCAKCGRWLHVKTTQINKKCLKCRRNHKVEFIKDKSEIVNGISPATKRIKELQHELAQKEQGSLPDLRTDNDFCIIGKTANHLTTDNISSTDGDTNVNYSKSFYKALIKLNLDFQSFPFYMIELLAEELEIPKLELKILLQEFIKAKILIPLPNQYYRIDGNSKFI